ncbi:hypothetical protein ACX0HA_00825 [Flavobacterium hauense]
MKKQIFTLSFALCAAFGYSQIATNTFPTTGKAGVNTVTPAYSLDVISPVGLATTGNPYTLTFVGDRQLALRPNPSLDSGLLTQIYSYGTISTRLQSLVSNQKLGFIDFNARATTNTTVAAITIGSAGSELMRINQDGKVRIGAGASDIKTPNGYKLFVEQGILTEKVKVSLATTTDWADYVFASDYKLMPLEDVEKFTKENKHLPNVPSAAEMVNNGLDVAKMDAKLMEKVEELTLYLIEQNKQIELLKAEINALKEQKK